jgi:hypothetical protein
MVRSGWREAILLRSEKEKENASNEGKTMSAFDGAGCWICRKPIPRVTRGCWLDHGTKGRYFHHKKCWRDLYGAVRSKRFSIEPKPQRRSAKPKPKRRIEINKSYKADWAVGFIPFEKLADPM